MPSCLQDAPHLQNQSASAYRSRPGSFSEQPIGLVPPDPPPHRSAAHNSTMRYPGRPLALPVRPQVQVGPVGSVHVGGRSGISGFQCGLFEGFCLRWAGFAISRRQQVTHNPAFRESVLPHRTHMANIRTATSFLARDRLLESFGEEPYALSTPPHHHPAITARCASDVEGPPTQEHECSKASPRGGFVRNGVCEHACRTVTAAE